MSGRKYHKWGKVWQVLQAKNGCWYAGCLRGGYEPMILDKLGTAASCDEMQVIFDRWAVRNGAARVRVAGELCQGRLL